MCVRVYGPVCDCMCFSVSVSVWLVVCGWVCLIWLVLCVCVFVCVFVCVVGDVWVCVSIWLV